jgi:hypothetical protein
MAHRISIVMVVFLCGVLPLAAQSSGLNIPIWYSNGDLAKKATLVGVSNAQAGKENQKKKRIVMQDNDKGVVVIDPSKVEQVTFTYDPATKGPASDPKDKKYLDKLKLHNGTTLTGNILSIFEIEVDDVGITIDRTSSKQILFASPKKAKDAGQASPPPPPDAAPAETKSVSLYPFWEPPQVLAVKRDGDCCKLPTFCALENCVKKSELYRHKNSSDKENIYTYRFRGPANFPQPRFDDLGQPQYVQGTVIYEGMQLLVAHDGRYELTFNASTPQVEVTLRLNLTFCVSGEEPVCLTLPSVSLMPEYRSANQDLGTTTSVSSNFQKNWHVRLTGYSVELAQAYQAGKTIEIHRDGVARFGSLPFSR